MSKIILGVERPNGLLHMAETESGKTYWISTIHAEMPLASAPETIVVERKSNGSTSKKAFEKPILEKRFGSIEEAEKFHRYLLENLEKEI